jgi:predicted nucleic acid-binding protein
MKKNWKPCMKIYVLDANAVIRYLSDGPDADRVEALIRRAGRGEAKLIISVINWCEAIYSLARRRGLERATADLKTMSASVECVAADAIQAEAAAALRLHYGLGMADCFAAALAIRTNATLVTADPDFSKLKRKIKLLTLSRAV